MKRFGPMVAAIVLALAFQKSYAQDPGWLKRDVPPSPPGEPLIEEFYRKNGKGSFGDAQIKRSMSGGVVDGKVTGLNSTTFSAAQLVRRRNTNGAFTYDDAAAVVLAILRDDAIDDGELDLLNELTQGQFRAIAVTPTGSGASKVVMYPASGNAKKLLQETLNPPLSLEHAWSQGSAGWNKMTTAYKRSPIEEARVLYFVAGKLEAEWGRSARDNAYKPFRDLNARMLGYSGMPGADADTGRTLLHRANKLVDEKLAGAVPDFMYNWIKPGGYL